MVKTNILLVDDELAFVETLTKYLVKWNFNVTPAHNGHQALSILKQRDDIEVVILDVKMPGMDGLETLTAIKAAHPLVEVIMLTGHATVDAAIRGMRKGAFDYLMKPCSIEVLVTKVAEAAARKKHQEEKMAEFQAP